MGVVLGGTGGQAGTRSRDVDDRRASRVRCDAHLGAISQLRCTSKNHIEIDYRTTLYRVFVRTELDIVSIFAYSAIDIFECHFYTHVVT